MNVRTSARDRHGRGGVWFCTLDADSPVAVATGRIGLGAPYRWARTQLEHPSGRVAWSSRRRGDHVTSAVTAAPVPGEAWRSVADDLERHLIERYVLFSSWHGRLLRARLEHASWTIVPGRLDALDTGIVTASGIAVTGDPVVHLGRPVDVSLRAPRLVR